MDAEVVLDGVRADRMQRLYARFAPRAGRVAYLLTGDHDLAEDLAQEAFVRAFARIKRLRDPNAFGSYMTAVVVNLTRKHWRKLSHERAYLAREAPAQTRRHVEMPDVAARDDLLTALRKLPYEQRAAIVLRFFEDLTEREAAAVLGCRPGTVKSRVSRGLEALRIEMRGDEL